MSYLPSDPDLFSIQGLLAKYPRRGVLFFKLLENSYGNASFSKELQEILLAYIVTVSKSIQNTLLGIG
jgi:hypothetical protein